MTRKTFEKYQKLFIHKCGMSMELRYFRYLLVFAVWNEFKTRLTINRQEKSCNGPSDNAISYNMVYVAFHGPVSFL